MNRRNFLYMVSALSGGLALSGLATGETVPRRAGWLLGREPGRCCHSSRDSSSAVTSRISEDVAYQGTHILTYGALRTLAARFEAETGQRFVVFGGGCDDGITAVRSGGVDLGGMCCPIKGSRAQGMPWVQVAWDIKVVVVHPSQSVDDVPEESLREIVAGRIGRWSEIGGDDRPIAVVYREHCPDYFEPVRQLLMANQPEWSPRGMEVETDHLLVDTVSRFPGALGVVSWVFAKDLVAAGQMKVLTIDGVSPVAAEVETGRYTLIGPLNLVFETWRDDRMGPLFEYMYSEAGQVVMSEALVPVPPGFAGSGPPPARLIRYI